MHPKYTYPSLSYVLYTAYVPEIYRSAARRHPTCISAPSVWFKRDTSGRDVLVMGPVELKTPGGVWSTSHIPSTLPLTPTLQPLKVSAGDWDVTILELGGHPLTTDEQVQDDEAQEDDGEYSDSEHYEDSELEYDDDEAERGETCGTALVSPNSRSGDAIGLLSNVTHAGEAINTDMTDDIVQDLEVCDGRNSTHS